LVHCADGLSDLDPTKAERLKLQNEGMQYFAEQQQLIQASNYAFYYTPNDVKNDSLTAQGLVQNVEGKWVSNVATLNAGISGNFIIGYGGTVGVGVYANSNDIGLFWNLGTGYGFDPSLGWQFGTINGPASSMHLNSTNVNLGLDFGGVGVGGSTLMFNGNKIGDFVNFGIRGVPAMPGATAATTTGTTCTIGISNIFSSNQLCY